MDVVLMGNIVVPSVHHTVVVHRDEIETGGDENAQGCEGFGQVVGLVQAFIYTAWRRVMYLSRGYLKTKYRCDQGLSLEWKCSGSHDIRPRSLTRQYRTQTCSRLVQPGWTVSCAQ